MMMIVRMFPRNDLKDSWDRVLNNLDQISDGNCTPLYMSQQEEKDFMSIIFDVKDVDAFADVLVKRACHFNRVSPCGAVTVPPKGTS